MKKTLIGLTTGLLLAGATAANATPVQWSSATGGNDHWYDVITTNSTISWESASTSVPSGWHLVTITSALEDRFVYNTLLSQISISPEYYWLGGYQPNGSNPNDYPNIHGWAWVNGESWGYTNWSPNEPNNGMGGTQHYLHYWPQGVFGWDDMDNRTGMVGYVIEKDFSPVPEPATIFLFGTGLIGLAAVGRRKIG